MITSQVQLRQQELQQQQQPQPGPPGRHQCLDRGSAGASGPRCLGQGAHPSGADAGRRAGEVQAGGLNELFGDPSPAGSCLSAVERGCRKERLYQIENRAGSGDGPAPGRQWHSTGRSPEWASLPASESAAAGNQLSYGSQPAAPRKGTKRQSVAVRVWIAPWLLAMTRSS